MKNVIAMSKLVDRIKLMYQVKFSNYTLNSLIDVFKNLKADVMTRSEIIETIKQYQTILNEEFKKNKP